MPEINEVGVWETVKNRKCFQCEKVDVRKVGIGLLAIYAGYSLCYLLNLMTGGKVFTQSLLSAGLFAVVFGCLFWFGRSCTKWRMLHSEREG